MQPQVGIVIPCFQAAKHLPYCLPPLLQSPLKPRILVIDSSSSDGTVEIAKAMGVETLVIPYQTFNHGSTREKGRQILRTPIIVMMTQDAYAASHQMLEHLIHPLLTKKASVSYARQIPHQGASIFASFSRDFNYPHTSHIRSLADVKSYGVYTFFCSNSCAAYLNSVLDEVNGFPSVLFGEDTITVAKFLHRKHYIAYVAEAVVHHSHNYNLKQEFCRHVKMGLTRRIYRELLAIGGRDSRRGRSYFQALVKELWLTNPLQIPYAFLQTAVKYCGYWLGQASSYIPLGMKKRFSI